MDKQINFKVSQELWLAFRMKLLQRGETAQSVLEQAVKDYLNPKEGNEMKKYCFVNRKTGKAGKGYSLKGLVGMLKQEDSENYYRIYEEWQNFYQTFPDEENAENVEQEFLSDLVNNWNQFDDDFELTEC